jgi:hypothetical protein
MTGEVLWIDLGERRTGRVLMCRPALESAEMSTV